MADETNEYNAVVKVRLFSTLNAQRLKDLIVIALWDEAEGYTLDGDTDELEVLEYEEITVEEVK